MPLWIEWLKDHWLSFLLIVGIIVAIGYVILEREELFNKG